MRNLLLLTAALFSVSLASATVTVTVTTPTNNQQVGSPFTLQAHASSQHTIVGWHVYLDGNNVYTGGQTNSISASINASDGNHQVVTRAWDSTGAYGSYTQTITVSGSGGGGGGGNGLPTPPSNAIWFNNIQNRGGWNWCHSSSCAGGSGQGSYWMAQHQGNPSRSGSSAEFYNSGVWGNSLWWQKLGANDGVHNFLWDFWFYIDSNANNYGQALEFDTFQFVGGYNYMIGSECDFNGSGKWDTWDEASGHWVHSTINCPRFSTGAWHHIQWYVTTNTSNHTYKYVTLVVDGHSYPVNITQTSKNLHWGDNLGVQWQLDDNARGGGYHEWIDNATLAIW